jgi:hypothetical protein
MGVSVTIGDEGKDVAVGDNVANGKVGSMITGEISLAQPTINTNVHKLINKRTKSNFLIILSL